MNYDGECRHLHGHNGRIEVDIESDETDHRGMVVDFADVKDTVKTWIDDNLDHRMILHRDDPLVSVLSELGEAHYVIDRNPTAENIAAHIHEMTSSDAICISEIRLWRDAQLLRHLPSIYERTSIVKMLPHSSPQQETAVLASGGMDSCILLANVAQNGIAHPIYVETGIPWEWAEKQMFAQLHRRVGQPERQTRDHSIVTCQSALR